MDVVSFRQLSARLYWKSRLALCNNGTLAIQQQFRHCIMVAIGSGGGGGWLSESRARWRHLE
jgi:hypothetical protein